MLNAKIKAFRSTIRTFLYKGTRIISEDFAKAAVCILTSLLTLPFVTAGTILITACLLACYAGKRHDRLLASQLNFPYDKYLFHVLHTTSRN